MATWSSEYVPVLLKTMHNATQTVGTDPMGTDHSTYLKIVEQLCLVAMILKIIQDLHPGVATDQEFLNRLNISLDTGPNGDKSGWPGWVLLQVPPEMLPMYGATESDSVTVLQTKINAYNALHSS